VHTYTIQIIPLLKEIHTLKTPLLTSVRKLYWIMFFTVKSMDHLGSHSSLVWDASHLAAATNFAK